MSVMVDAFALIEADDIPVVNHGMTWKRDAAIEKVIAPRRDPPHTNPTDCNALVRNSKE